MTNPTTGDSEGSSNAAEEELDYTPTASPASVLPHARNASHRVVVERKRTLFERFLGVICGIELFCFGLLEAEADEPYMSEAYTPGVCVTCILR